MGQFRKKPVVIEAIQFEDTAECLDKLSAMFEPRDLRVNYEDHEHPFIRIETLEGEMKAEVGDFIIKGVKGELYPCKPDIFEATYVREDEPAPIPRGCLPFEQALLLLKAGKHVRRSGWNGKGMHLAIMPGYPSGIGVNAATARAMEVPEGTEIRTRPYLMMKDAQGYMVTGWLASQTDLLADDWEVVP